MGRIGRWLLREADRSDDRSRARLLRLLENGPPVSTMLDCGAAAGETTAMIARAARATTVMGLEIVPEHLEALRARGIEPILGSLDDGIPLPDGAVDLVVASHVIEHVADTDKLVLECFRVLKPGGRFAVVTPNLGAALNIFFLLMGKQPTVAEVSDVALPGTWSPRGREVRRVGPGHRRLFTKGALLGLLEYHGFERGRVVSSGFLPVPGVGSAVLTRALPRFASNLIAVARKP